MTSRSDGTMSADGPTQGRSSGADVGGGWCGEWIAAWNRFWFTPADPLPLSLVRIATGGLFVWASLVWLLDAEAFFGADGWQRPDNVWRMNDQPWQWSWYFPAGNGGAVRMLAGATLLAAVLLTLGLATPVAAAVSLLGFLSATNRAPLNVFGFDDTLGMLLIGLVVGPAGARFSVDRLLAPDPAAARPSVRANLALRLIQVHLCVMYLFSGCGKLLGASWWEGTALWGAAANVQYRTMDLTWLAWHPYLTNLLTLVTLWWEVAYAAIVWPRLTRRLALAVAVPVHLGIGLAMGMMEFGLAMLVANMTFVPAATLRAVFGPPRSDSSRSSSRRA